MSKTIRQPVYNGFLQNDFDCAGKRLLNCGGIDVVNSHTVFVDGTGGDDGAGKVGSQLAFKTLGSALAAINAAQRDNPDDRSSYVLIWRGGTYAIDGAQEIHVSGLTIFAYGVILTSDTATNEETKLLITSPNITIEGLTIDGAVSTGTLPAGYDSSDQPHGLIEVNRASNFTLRNCTLKNAAASGVYGVDGYDGLTIKDCIFDSCQLAVQGVLGGSNDVRKVVIRDNDIATTRRAGLQFTGSGNTTTKVGFRDLSIKDNTISHTDTLDLTRGAIEVLDFSRDVRITGNHIDVGSIGIHANRVARLTLFDNTVTAVTDVNVWVDGCQDGDILSNTLDATGITTAGGILIGGSYVTTNDAGPFVVMGNIVLDSGTDVHALEVNNASNVLVHGNRFDGTLSFGATSSFQIFGNVVRVGDLPLRVLALDRAISGIVIGSNRFSMNGSGQTALIELVDANAVGIDDVEIKDNTSTRAKVYSDGILKLTGTAATNVIVRNNTPITNIPGDNTRGWVNDVVNARVTGWAAATGTKSKATFVTDSVTLPNLAARVGQIIDDLIAHGLIGT